MKRERNIKKLLKEIKPFVKLKKYIKYSTAGKWILTEELSKYALCNLWKEE